MLLGKLRQFTLESLEPLALLRDDLGGRVLHETRVAELGARPREFLLDLAASLAETGNLRVHVE